MVLATLKTDLEITATPISPEKFAPFGGVISSAHQLANVHSESANYGTATKLFKVSPIVNNYILAPSGERAIANWNMFRCSPPTHLIASAAADADAAKGEASIYTSKVLERHPFSTQTFVPMGRDKNAIAYMVIVAPTASDGLPELSGLKAFTVKGDQAVTYGAGTWHAPMIALGDVVDFAVLIHENGVANEDCQEVYLETVKVKFSSTQTPALSTQPTAASVGKVKKRKEQSQEAFEQQLASYHQTGPVYQTHSYFDGSLDMPTNGKIDLNRIKSAAERQYYLRNYSQAVHIVEANAAKVSGKLAQELDFIRRLARGRM